MQKRLVELSVADAASRHEVPVDSDDEISLADLWLIVRKRWPWLLAGLLAGIFAAVAYVMLTVPTYESRTSIQIGNVPETAGLIEDIGALGVQLMDQYGPESGDGVERRMPHLKEAAADPRRNNILKLATVGYSPAEARDFLAQIVAKLMQRHDRLYGNAIDPLRRRLVTLDEQIGFLKVQVAELGDLVARLKESQPAQAALVAIERGRLYGELNDLERDRVILQQRTAQPYSTPSAVIVRAVLPDEPAAPRKLWAAAIGIVLGLVLGLAAVFFRESFASARAAGGPGVRAA